MCEVIPNEIIVNRGLLGKMDKTANVIEHESRLAARKPRDAAAVLLRLKFADNIHYKFQSSQSSKAWLQSSKHTGGKQNLMQNGHSRSRILESGERRSGTK